MKRLAFFLAFLWLSAGASAQNTPKYANEYLAIGVGARGMAMANTQAALAQDVTAGYWNPAGLVHIPSKWEATAMHASYFAGLANYDYAAFAAPTDPYSAVGVSLIRFGVDDIPDTRFLFDADGNLDYSNVRSFSAADYALLVSYARKTPGIIRGLSFGGSAKLLYRNVGQFANAYGFGLDLGVMLKRKRWQFGISGRDVTGTFTNWAFNPDEFREVFTLTGNEIPEQTLEVALPRAIVGIGYTQPIKDLWEITLSTGYDVTFDGRRNTVISDDPVSVDPHAGLEVGYRKTVYVRGGIGQFQEIKNFDGSTRWQSQPNFGLGLVLRPFTIDYAFTDALDQSDALYSHVFSLKVSVGERPTGSASRYEGTSQGRRDRFKFKKPQRAK